MMLRQVFCLSNKVQHVSRMCVPYHSSQVITSLKFSTICNTIRQEQQQQQQQQQEQKQKSNAEEEKNNKEEKEKKYKPFISPMDEERLPKMPINSLEKAKETLSKLRILLFEDDTFKSRIAELAKIPNEPNEKLFTKMIQFLSLMFEARRKIVVQDIPALSSFPEKHADQIFRLNLAKWTLKDEEFLKQTHDFEDKIADQVFQVKLQRPYIMPGRVAVNIHLDARQDANKRLYDEHLNEALQYSKSEELANKFMEEKYVYWLYEEEMRLLKEQENWLAISKKKKKLYDIYMERMKEDAMSVSLEEWEKRQNLTMEDLDPEDERFVLATPEGFVNYKFQLAETMNQQG